MIRWTHSCPTALQKSERHANNRASRSDGTEGRHRSDRTSVADGAPHAPSATRDCPVGLASPKSAACRRTARRNRRRSQTGRMRSCSTAEAGGLALVRCLVRCRQSARTQLTPVGGTCSCFDCRTKAEAGAKDSSITQASVQFSHTDPSPIRQYDSRTLPPPRAETAPALVA